MWKFWNLWKMIKRERDEDIIEESVMLGRQRYKKYMDDRDEISRRESLSQTDPNTLLNPLNPLSPLNPMHITSNESESRVSSCDDTPKHDHSSPSYDSCYADPSSYNNGYGDSSSSSSYSSDYTSGSSGGWDSGGSGGID